MSTTALKKLSKGDLAKDIITLALPLIIMLMPTGEVFTATLRGFCAITLMAILCFAFENVNQTAVALLLPLCYIFFNVAPANVVFSPWLQYIPWSTLGGLVMAGVLESTGLLARIAYFCILKTGASYRGILAGIAIAGFLLTMFVGQVLIPMAALTYGICLALETGKSQESAAIMLTGAISCLLPHMAKFIGPLLMIGIGEPVTGKLPLLGFFEAWYVNAPAILFLIVMVVVVMFMFKPSQDIQGKEFFARKLKEAGKLSVAEWKTAAILCGYFLFVLFSKYTPFELTWGLAFIPMLMLVPGIGAGTAEDVKKLNFGFILFVTSCMSIGAVATSLGIGKIVSDVMMPMIAGKSYYVFFFIQWIMLVTLNFVMTPLAMQAAFTVPLATLGQSIGINPMAVYYFMMHGCDQIILPYEYALYMISFAFGLIRMSDFMKIMGAKMVVDFVIVFVVLLPWWKFVGFLFA